jgi:hypothetical protein
MTKTAPCAIVAARCHEFALFLQIHGHSFFDAGAYMNTKSFILGSAVAMSVISAAHATDAVVPDPVQPGYDGHVSACDAYGIGFISIAGTDTCMRVGGQLRFEERFSTQGRSTHGNTTLDFETRSD